MVHDNLILIQVALTRNFLRRTGGIGSIGKSRHPGQRQQHTASGKSSSGGSNIGGGQGRLASAGLGRGTIEMRRGLKMMVTMGTSRVNTIGNSAGLVATHSKRLRPVNVTDLP